MLYELVMKTDADDIMFFSPSRVGTFTTTIVAFVGVRTPQEFRSGIPDMPKILVYVVN